MTENILDEDQIREKNISAAVDQKWHESLKAVDVQIAKVMERMDNIQARLNDLVAELKHTHKKILQETDRVLSVIMEAEEATETLQKIAPDVQPDTLKLLTELFRSIEKWRNYEH